MAPSSRTPPARRRPAPGRRPAPTRRPSRPAARPAPRGKGAPRCKRGPRRRSWAWRYRRLLFLAGLLLFTALAGVLFLLSRVPLPTVQPTAQTTFLYDSHHRQLAELNAGQNRVDVPLSQVPRVVIDAVVSTEDRNFFHHAGVDPVGLARAVVADLRSGGAVQGGSTITQQYVKSAYVGNQRTVFRKLREAVLAVKVERRYTKSQILERYLNIIYLGRGAYGVQAAAQAYFGRDVGSLGLPEASLLAGLIRSPETADPDRSPEVARSRRLATLKSMARDHKISAAQRDATARSPLDALSARQVAPAVTDPAHGTQYFAEYIRQQLVSQFGEKTVYGGGLRVTTTIDLDLQQKAYDAVYGYLNRPGDPAAALVAIDDQGRVKAMVGGRDYGQSQVNLALGGEGGGTGRQAGSTFKAFLLAETIKEGYSVQSSFAGPPEVVIPHADQNGRDYTVTNFNHEDAGPSINLIDATAHSVNTVYAQVEQAIGPQHLVDMAHQLGVTSPLQANASLVLGSSDVSVLEMAGAYSTFADRGLHISPQAIADVTTADGTALPRPAQTRSQVLDRATADQVTYCLQQVVLRGTGTKAQFGKPVAGKTGTTTDYGDAWFIGYTPTLTTAVWMGYPEGSAHQMTDVRGIKVEGGSYPAILFSRFMTAATQGVDPGTFHTVSTFPGRTLRAPTNVVLPTTTTTAPAGPVPSVPGTTAPGTTTPPRPTTTVAAKPTSTTKPAKP
jgi:penicillin-binding protein 1A